MNPVNVRLAALLAFLLLPAAAMAQARAWTITMVPTPGETTARVVSDEASELTFVARNTGTNARWRITEFLFELPPGYVLLDPTPPAGWTPTVYDPRLIAFTTTAACPGGLQVGEELQFTLRVIPPADNVTTDRAGERFQAATGARDQCEGDASYSIDLNATSSHWVRSILSSGVTVRPRALGVGGDTLARVVVENRTSSTTNLTGITITGPTSAAGGATFQDLSREPANSQVSLPPRGAGIVSARLLATTEGSAVTRVSARNTAGTLTARTTESQVVDVGPLAAMVDVDNDQAFSNEEVQVRLTVANTTRANTYLDVRPGAPVLQGTATATLVSGPTPASVARLAPNTSAHFVWRYRITGAVHADYSFQAQASATLNGSATSTRMVGSARGRIVAHRVRISPNAMAATSSGANRTVVYTVQNRGPLPIIEVKLLRPAANFFASPQMADAAGWSEFVDFEGSGYTWASDTGEGIPPGGERSFSVTYGGIASVTAPTVFRHRLHLLSSDGSVPPVRIEAPVTLLGGFAPEVERLTAVARDASVTLTWDNPALHSGVLVLRATTPFTPASPAPVPGRAYAVGETLGSAQVVYTDANSAATSFTDTTVTNGTTYYYRVHNADDSRWYSAGNRPTSAGLIAAPRARGTGAPLWCYSVGVDARIQPSTEAGAGIFSSFNNFVVSNSTSTTNPAQDGAERWRPLPLEGTIGSRFPVVPLHGLSGQYLFTATQDGVAYAINASTGTTLWRRDSLGTIQSFAVTQLYDYANAAYRVAHPNRDLVFFATRLSGSTDNRVVALNAATGATVWTYQPGDLGMVSGGMAVDYVNNRLYVGSMGADSLRILDTLTGGEAARRSLGAIEHSVVRNALSRQFYISASNGTVHAVDQTTMDVAWSVPVAPGFTSFVRVLGGGFVASTSDNTVVLYDAAPGSPAGSQPVPMWAAPVPIANPSGVFTLNRSGVVYIFVGSSDGRVHQIDLATGTDTRQVSVGGAQLIGTPTIDSSVSRLHVGTQDGRICAFTAPFP